MKKVVRLNERQLTSLIKKVIMENPARGFLNNNQQYCDPEDKKPSSGRPLCTEVSITSGNLLAMGDMAFIQYTGEGNCPKLCKVANNTAITLA